MPSEVMLLVPDRLVKAVLLRIDAMSKQAAPCAPIALRQRCARRTRRARVKPQT
jgi:hypothetical protein